MDTARRISDVREHVARYRRAGERVALVPTMGNLHRGHLTLLELARQRAVRVVASVFVNPTQFGPGEDLDRYPRTLERDTQMLAAAGAALLFAPPEPEIYPEGAGQATLVQVPDVTGILEGSFRPGHFAGVATVVTRLFNIVQPDVAVFGEKDFQQLVVIRRLVRDLCMPVEIVAGPTAREDDGLALSSRNQYLDAEQRARAPRLQQALQAVRRRALDGDRDWAAIEAAAAATLTDAGFVPDYVAVRRAADLSMPDGDDRDLVVLVAARLGTTRLIDNLRIRL